jgi:hypothetical protein
MVDLFIEQDYRGGGNNANAGTSYALRVADITNGITAAKQAPGDNLKCMASPEGTVSGVVVRGGTATVDISTDVLTQVGHGHADGDMIVVLANSSQNIGTGLFLRDCTADTFKTCTTRGGTATNWTASGTVYYRVMQVEIPSGQIQSIADTTTLTGWTSAANITLATQTSRHSGRGTSILMTPAAGFTTGRLFSYDIGATTDLSAFSAVCINVFTGVSTGATTITLRFYSDASATTEIGGSALAYPTTTVSFIGSINLPLIFRAAAGAALPNNVRAIALEIDTDPVTTAWSILDILACHDWKVTPNSVSPWAAFATQAYGDAWYDPTVDTGPVELWGWLSDTKMTLAPKVQNAATPLATTGHAWPFATFSGTVYVYHHLAGNLWQNSNNNTVDGLTEAGTAALPVTCSGGWNRTDMSTQSGITFLRNLNGIGLHFGTNRAYVKISRFGVSGYQFSGNSGEEMSFSECVTVGATLGRFGPSSLIERPCNLNKLYISGGTSIINISGLACDIKAIAPTTINFSQNGYICRLGMGANNGLSLGGGNGRNKYSIGQLYVRDIVTAISRNAGCNVSCEYFYPTNITNADSAANSSGYFGICRYNGVYNDCRAYGQWWSSTRDTAIVDSGATASFKIGVNNSGAREDFPISIPLLDHEFSTDPTGQTVTIACRIYRSSTNLGIKLIVCAGMIVDTQQSATAVGSAGTWETLTISFTANNFSMIGLWLQLWSTDATSFVYINTETISITKA